MKISTLLVAIGTLAIGFALVILILTFFPVIAEELMYALNRPNPNAVVTNQKLAVKGSIKPVDDNFGIVIPKIGANSKIIPQVDPYNSNIYQWALTKGVAQAKGTKFPGENGNMFLFSHSSVNFYEALQYNSVFYLLSKLQKNDTIYIFYNKRKYIYKVTGTKLVDPKDVSFLSGYAVKPTITLMTCWPAGTTLKRLLVIGTIQ